MSPWEGCSAVPRGYSAVTSRKQRSWNRYAYALNGPLNSVDPLGLSIYDCIWNGGCNAPCNAYCSWGGGGGGGGGGGYGAGYVSPGIFFTGPLWAIEGANEAAYGSWISAMWAAGGSAVTSPVNRKTYSIDWSMDGGAFYVAPNGEILDASDVTELGLKALGAADAPDYSLPGSGGTGNGSGGAAGGCSAKILSAVNGHFGTNFTSANVGAGAYAPFEWPQVPGGTVNIDIFPSQGQDGISPGRYPVNWWTYIIGYGSTLHIPAGPGGLDSPATLTFSGAQFTAHLDSAFPYNPIGGLIHWLKDVRGVGGHSPCP